MNKLLPALLLLLCTGCDDRAAPTRDAAGNVGPPASSPTREPGRVPAGPTTNQAAAAPATSADDPRLAVEAEGLRWFLPPNGSARPLPFGSDQQAVLVSLERVRGPAARGTNVDCGAGPVETATWADGLSLLFQKGKFVGWGLDGRAAGAIGTANGIEPGTTRAELEGNVANVRIFGSTLGTEFAAGGFYGLLDGTRPTSRITDLWAGVSCVAR